MQPYKYSNGDVYSGCFKDGSRHGRGKLFLASGSYFEGYFSKGMLFKGKYYFVNGNIYVNIIKSIRKVNLKMEDSMEEEYIYGLMENIIMANGI